MQISLAGALFWRRNSKKYVFAKVLKVSKESKNDVSKHSLKQWVPFETNHLTQKGQLWMQVVFKNCEIDSGESVIKW